ncbi:LacI family DNA-binding transcriptional regulator [Aquimarina sp. TRL1]|uniref:LacI family DNA-binding transcriptional regulator n=1 Tax=Aquimarina sp. (strain TRL1) TaxID=2736252 RepID=UPI00158A0CC4|nr:LacI family DNA-binding transcriptional regulator [Aquimarina sp. TRL1]QKX06830.1 LacI family DNA-binding transcriptional regulator [Aquimarina sp. TRL1]
MKKKYTIKDIAKLANVSKGTVDRVLHNRGKVSQASLDKVNEVLQKIDYQPNLIARNLKNNKVYHICILLPDPEIDPYWSPCVPGIETAIMEFKSFGFAIEPFYFDPNKTASFLETHAQVLSLKPDAVLLASLFYKESIQAVEEYPDTTVISVFNTFIDNPKVKNFVGQDLYQSGRVGAKLMHMVTKGEGVPLVVHVDEQFSNAIHMQEKEKGFRTYYKEYVASEDVKTITVSKSEVRKELVEILTDNKDINGCFITTSKVFQVADIIRDVNKEIAIIGYDLLKENVSLLEKDFVDFLIHQNPERQVYLGVSKLVEFFLFKKEMRYKRLLPIDIVTSENVSSYLS